MNLKYGSSDSSSDSPNISLFSSENAWPCVAGEGSSDLSCITGPSGTAATAIKEGGSTQASDWGEVGGGGVGATVVVVVGLLLGALVVVVVVGFASLMAEFVRLPEISF